MRFFEDLEVGQKFLSGTMPMTAERIKTFATEFDPQPFHLDEAAAKDTFFGGLVASGWHTAAVTMRLIVEAGIDLAGGTLGGGVQVLRWPRPVHPGDVLQVEVEVVELRPSRKHPGLGVVKVRATTFNQAAEPVQISTPVLLVPRRRS